MMEEIALQKQKFFVEGLEAKIDLDRIAENTKIRNPL